MGGGGSCACVGTLKEIFLLFFSFSLPNWVRDIDFRLTNREYRSVKFITSKCYTDLALIGYVDIMIHEGKIDGFELY